MIWDTPRPQGILLWLHAAEPGNLRAVADLARHMTTRLPGSHVLLTSSDPEVTTHETEAILCAHIDSDHPDFATAFVDHWAPDAVMWTWGDLLPNLLNTARARAKTMVLLDAARNGFDKRRAPWLTDVATPVLDLFDRIYTRSQLAHLHLAHLGHPLDQISQGLPLRPMGHILPAIDSDIIEMTEALRARPCWLAARVYPNEVSTVLMAHRNALKASHRLLLILLVHRSGEADAAIEAARKRGLSVCDFTAGAMPSDSNQVLVADAEEELGLWLRLAPVVFAGGSMADETLEMDPYMIAAHGAAVVYGPYVAGTRSAYKRLLDAGAARIISDPSSLGLALTQMTAPDRAAEMAMAGWDLLSEATESLSGLLDHVCTVLSATDTRLN